jgi:hypothetical protein
MKTNLFSINFCNQIYNQINMQISVDSYAKIIYGITWIVQPKVNLLIRSNVKNYIDISL